MNENDEPAFPIGAPPGPEDGTVLWATGMTLRDWFAGHALQNLRQENGFMDEKIAAQRSYEYADAMLLERLK